MKNLKCLLVLSVVPLLFLDRATAGTGGHGGGSCDQSVLEMKTVLKHNLYSKLPASTFPEVNPDVFDHFYKTASVKLVPSTSAGTDAESFRDTNEIHLSRAVWCNRPDLKKQSVLFHEYLVLMRLEDTNDYHISARYIPAITESENQTVWICQSMAYFGPSNNLTVRDSSPSSRGPVYADTPIAAFDKMLGMTPGWRLCKRIAPNPLPAGSDTVTYSCVEEATLANSCVRQK